METHSDILAWKILQAEEPGGLYIVHGVVKSQTQLSCTYMCTIDFILNWHDLGEWLQDSGFCECRLHGYFYLDRSLQHKVALSSVS